MAKKTLSWVGGEHEFALHIGQLRALQDNTQAGPEQLLRRMASGDWRIDDLVETIRLGLIGGGLPSGEAGPLVMRLFQQHPIIEFKSTAYQILGAALVGVEDDPVGEPQGATAPQENGNSAISTS